MQPDVRERLREIYATVDAAVAAAAPRCDASGRCCRFEEYGHTLFLSHFEAEILLETAPPFPKPATPVECPFQVNNLCTAREERPLGCRVYFCDPSFQDQQGPLTEAAIAQLKQLADEFQTGWKYARLHEFLNESNRPHDSLVKTEPPAASRMSLPVV